MKIIKASFYQLPIEICKFFIAFGFYLFDPASAAFTNITRTSIVTLIAMFLYFTIVYFKRICKPIKISIILTNNVTREKSTHYYAHSQNNESERTIMVKITIEKTRSILSWLGKILIKNKYCSYHIAVSGDYFSLIPEHNRIINKGQQGFDIDLTEIVRQLVNENSSKVIRAFTFIIAENRDADINNDCEVDINSKYTVNGKEIGFFHSLLYNVEEDKHLIKFYKNYMGLQMLM